MERINSSIELGVNFLHEHQLPNGEFMCYISPDEDMQYACGPDSIVFNTTLIAYPLMFLKDHPKVKNIHKEAGRFLLYQMMYGGVWNYFTRWNKAFPVCPPDIDDTAMASLVLKMLGIDHCNPEQMLLLNRNSKGLFYTWFLFRLRKTTYRPYWHFAFREFKHPLKSLFFWANHEVARNDIDGVVNANMLFYLGYSNSTVPIVKLLLKIVEENKEADCDRTYRNPFTFYYYVSRNYFKGIKELEPARQPIISRILESANANGQLGTSVMDNALAACTLLNLNYYGKELENSIQSILDTQQTAGNWVRWHFFYSGPKKAAGWGSEELTTSFCLEALARFRKYKKGEQE